jgi:hypothetical protein
MDPVAGEWPWLTNLASAATVVTGIAVVLAVVPFFQGRKRERQQADQWYVDRYWQLQDLKRPRRRRSRQVIVAVPFAVRWAEVRLCEDELDARANGWITNDSWNLWKGSILVHRDDPEMCDLVKRSPPGELGRLREYWLTGQDPIEINRWTQFWRGIR